MKYLPFKEPFTPASQNANGFPENWTEEFEIDVDKDSDTMGGWSFETDGSMVEINPSIDTSNGNYVYTSYSESESGQIRLSKEISPFPLKLYNSILFLADARIPRSDIFSFIRLAANLAEAPAAMVVLKVSPARSGKYKLSS